MASEGEERFGHRLGRVMCAVSRHPGRTLLAACALAALALVYAGGHLGVNSQTDDLFDEHLPFRKLRAEVDRALPARNDNLLVVLDAPTRLRAEDAVAWLVAEIEREPERFASAWAPGAGPFFERHGLLFLEVEELWELADRLAAAQPFLADLVRDPSLRGLFGILTRAIDEGALSRGGFDVERVLEGVTRAIAAAEGMELRPQAFGELVLGGEERGSIRRYVLVQPRPDYEDFVPGRASVERLHEILAQRGWNAEGPVRARVTGDLALKTEELGLVKDQAARSGIVSFLLVAGILGFGLRSGRLIGGTLLALVLGLVWTAGFAALAVGHLNVISVAFAVLFIGLGVDFGIHLSLRYRELREEGAGHSPALERTGRSVGGSLVLCALTTAVGFYAFVPTGFRGVAELGVISGTGMWISLVAMLTVLPAVLGLGRAPRFAGGRRMEIRLPSWPTRWPGVVCAASGALSLASLALLPRLHFDANPLHVRDPEAPSVQTFFELIEGGDVNPWSIEVLAPDLAQADALARRLEALPSVARTTTLSSYVPTRQDEKLEVLEEIALFLGFDELEPLPPPGFADEERSLHRFRRALVALERAEGDERRREVAVELGSALDRFMQDLDGTAVETLRASLVNSVLDRVRRLQRALGTRGFGLPDLPEALRRRMVAADGRALIEVYPEGSLADPDAVATFVREVRSVTPAATGTSVYMFEAASAIMDALGQALVTAGVLVTLLLLGLWRNPRDTALALAPLVLAALLTSALAVLLELPINFANVIVVPLLLGIGVDSGIHLVHRYRDGALARGILETSTARAVLWSALTTIASFGALGLASHRGLATLGQLLSLGVGVTLACNLVFLPALLTLVNRARRRPRPG